MRKKGSVYFSCRDQSKVLKTEFRCVSRQKSFSASLRHQFFKMLLSALTARPPRNAEVFTAPSPSIVFFSAYLKLQTSSRASAVIISWIRLSSACLRLILFASIAHSRTELLVSNNALCNTLLILFIAFLISTAKRAKNLSFVAHEFFLGLFLKLLSAYCGSRVSISSPPLSTKGFCCSISDIYKISNSFSFATKSFCTLLGSSSSFSRYFYSYYDLVFGSILSRYWHNKNGIYVRSFI